MSREAKQREERRKEKLAVRRERMASKDQALMRQAAEQLEFQRQNLDLLQERVDYYRNIFVGSAFAAGLGNERTLTELVAEAHPLLLGINFGRADVETMAAL